jgi:adenylate cyclase
MALICLFTSFAGVIYQLIDEKRLDYNSVVVGFSLGLVFGVLEVFLFPKAEMRFRQWTFTKLLLFKTLLYTAVIYAVTITLSLISGLSEGRKISELPAYMVSVELMVLVVYTLVIYGLLVSFLQINNLLGEGVLWKFILGKYHKPREEERIFMFLDI